jgi:hypothetical protein
LSQLGHKALNPVWIVDHGILAVFTSESRVAQ